MKIPVLAGTCATVLLATGCETLQSPQHRQQEAARQQAALRMADERFVRLQGRVESIEMEHARLLQEVQQLRAEMRAAGQQVASLGSNVQSLEARQGRETKEVVQRVEGLLKRSAAAQPAAPARGAGREHTVESGHTLSAIASAYGTTVNAIKQANNLKSDQIFVGQKLFIPQ